MKKTFTYLGHVHVDQASQPTLTRLAMILPHIVLIYFKNAFTWNAVQPGLERSRLNKVISHLKLAHMNASQPTGPKMFGNGESMHACVNFIVEKR